jgi:hypothetical protein
MKQYAILAVFAAALLIPAARPWAQEHVSKEVIAGGGGKASGGGFILTHTLGQTTPVEASGGGYITQSGFLYLPWQVVTDASGGGMPLVSRLYQNYPNPFNPFTTIKFSLSKDSKVSLKVYDVAGRVVRTVIDREMSAGVYEIPLQANGLTSGVYFLRLRSGNLVQTRKMVLLR